MTDKMREIAKNAAWERLKFESKSGSFWDVDEFQMFDAGYDAATAESTVKIANLVMELAAWQGLHKSAQIQKAQMQARIDELVNLLNTVNTCIKNGVAIMIPNTLLEYEIDEALAKVKDEN